MRRPDDTREDLAPRALAWHRRAQAAICDVQQPWAHGTVVRATRHPSYYDYNAVRVEDDPAMTVEALAAFAEQALAGLDHRRVDFDLIDVAQPLRAQFEARGWTTQRLLTMRLEQPPPPGPCAPVEEVAYEVADELRAAWHQEDFPGPDPADFHAAAREVALAHGVTVLAQMHDGAPIAFAEIERDGASAEITRVYVSAERRGRGLGTALTRTAIRAAGDVRDLWITADDEDRPKHLYARLGFTGVWTQMKFLRVGRPAAR
jgi:ribosomal protein S18 acetylase RimI-like enzyme